ncbi:hypothetical protein [Streptomyces sp. NPDC048565]|uniref:hypothetical protein n=1 Tax=Streptomyces sp. NPDC048565 TaxID=3155266 RepID=UPI00342455EB
MSIALPVIAIILALFLGGCTLLLLGSQVELFRSLQQVREQAGLLDRATPVDLGGARGLRASEVGLPTGLDTETSALVLFLSDKCFVCRSIAAGLQGALPPGVWLVLDPGSAGPDAQLAPALGFNAEDEKVVVDPERKIMKAIGTLGTPLVLAVEHGRITRASGITSTRQVYELAGSALPQRAHPESDHVKQEGMMA